MNAEEIHREKLKKWNYKPKAIEELVAKFRKQGKYGFAEACHQAQLKLLGIANVSNSTELVKPTMEKYGWQGSSSFDEESGWMHEGGEDAYYEALKKWETAQ